MNNDEFINGLQQRDPAAARHLNECFVPSIWRFVFFRVGGDAHLAEDIVSETVLALVSAASEESNIEHPAAWLRTVASRRIHDHFRAAARVQHLMEQTQRENALVDDQDPNKKHDQKLQRQQVRDAMDGLTESYRLALEWKYIDGLSVKVIANRLDTTEKSAESLLFRARNTLRQLLQCEQPPRSDPKPASDTTQSSLEKTKKSENSSDSENESKSTRCSLYIPPLASES